MKIKTKLLLINGGLLFSFLLSIAFYLFMTLPSIRIEREKKVLLKLELEFLEYRTAINQIPYALYLKQKAIVQDLGSKTLDSFKSISELNTLIEASDKIAQAIEKIGSIFNLVENNYNRLDSEMLKMEKDANTIFGTISGFRVSDFYSKKEALEYEKIKMVFNQLTHVNSAILSMDYNIASSLRIINKQMILIDEEVTRLQQKSLTFTLLVIVGLFTAVILIVILVSNKLARSLTVIMTKIEKMRDGDLTVRFNDKYQDDIGLLCQDLNNFQENLSHAIHNIQEISDNNISVQNDLVVTVKQTDESSTLIDNNASEINQKIEVLKENIDVSSQAVDKVDSVFNTLNDQVVEQMAMVEESTASVTEMISSIDSIAKITVSKTAAIDQLVKTSADGTEKLKDTTNIIKHINDKIDNISQMAGVIKRIASQTNLLAMNAAIEAAHAGDSGRGFAVVSDEIRKLAEASSKQSNEISSDLKDIVENIEKAQDSGNITNVAFSEVDKEISQFSQSLYEISASISELKSGGEQILSAMTSLQDISFNVKNSSNDLSDASSSMKNEMDSVKNISEEVHNKIGVVSVGIGEVSNSINSITKLANIVGRVTENLNSEIGHFKTNAEEKNIPLINTAEDLKNEND